jgi:hypothetical protein
MNVCLVSAPVATDFKTRDEIDSCLGEPAVSEPQLGVLSLAAVLETRHHKVRVVDLDQAYLANLDSPRQASSFAEHAAQLIVAEPADVYGFSSICSSYPLTVRIAKAVKAARSESMVLFGGPQASVVDWQTLAAFSFVDFVLRGEAEVTLPVLLDELAGEGRLSIVPGLTYRCRSQLCRNGAAPIIDNLDALPSPAYHLTGGLRGADKASLELGRGCPYACTFCSTNDFFRRKFRLRSPERVIRDMEQIANAYGILQFELIHDMFTVDRRRVVSFCEAMLASGNGFEWSCSARTDSVDEELLELMARAGCVGIFYGVESGSQRLQKIFEKDLDVERAKLVVAATERLGMRSTVSLITGFPEETEDDLRQTLRMFIFSARHAQSTPHLNILAPLAATPIYLKYRDQMTLGDLCSDISQQGPVQDFEDWTLIEEHAEIFPNFYLLPTPHLDRGRLLELREFALNGVGHFRWLLCAIHQSSYPVYDLFLQWQQHRIEIKPLENGAELKRYYNSPFFRKDFLAFIQSSLPDNKTVRALLEFETVWSSSSNTLLNTFAHPAIADETLGNGEAPCATDIPVCSAGLNVIELSFDVQRIINALKHEIEPAWDSGTYHYMTPELSDPLKRLYRISRELGHLLRLCNGQHDISEIVEALAPEFYGIAGSQRNAAVLGLIQAAAQGGLLSIYRGPTRPGTIHVAA